MARATAPLRGYSRLGGSSERYRTPSGREISRREYQNRVARKLGWRNRYDLETFQESQGWQRWRHRLQSENRSVDVSYSSPLMRDAAVVVRARESAHARGERRALDLEPSGVPLRDTALGRLLNAAGLVDPDTFWDDGSPKPIKR